MKRFTVTLLMMGARAGMLLAQAQTKAADTKKPAASANAASDELKQIENDWADASKTKNAEKLGDFSPIAGWRLSGTASGWTRPSPVGNEDAWQFAGHMEMGPMTVRISVTPRW